MSRGSVVRTAIFLARLIFSPPVSQHVLQLLIQVVFPQTRFANLNFNLCIGFIKLGLLSTQTFSEQSSFISVQCKNST